MFLRGRTMFAPYKIKSKYSQQSKEKIRCSFRFFFCKSRRKRKSYKKESAEIEISRSAERDKSYALLMAQAFSKA